MTATTPTTPTVTPVAPRRRLAAWFATIAIAVLLGVLAVSGARLTWDTPNVTVQGEQAPRQVSAATIDRADALAAARGELTALRHAVREIPAIRHSVHDDLQLLAAVSSGQVPVQALDRADDGQLHDAVRAGHVPPQALEPAR